MNVAGMGYIRYPYIISVGKSDGKRLLGGLGVQGRIILKWIWREKSLRVWTAFS
jgi:hypothetical protein